MPKRRCFIGFLGLLLVLANFLFWRASFSLFAASVQIGTVSRHTFFDAAGFLGMFSFLLALICLVSTFIKDTKLILLILTLGSLPAVAVVRPPLIGAAAFAAALALSFFAARRLCSQITLHTKFSPSHILPPVLATLIFSFALMLGFVFYFAESAPAEEFKIGIPESVVEAVLQKVGSELGTPTGVTPNQLPDWTVQEMREEDLGGRLPEKFPQAFEGRSFSPQEFTRLLGQAGSETNAPFGTAQIKKNVEEELNTIIEPYRRFVPLLLTISLFLLVQFLSPFIRWLSVLIFSVLFKLAQILKLAKVEKVPAEVERPVLF